jgi:prepilin-type N-terminal cleavage/methylation domain-containing protein
MRRINHGFTLVELMVTMAILALLVLFVTSLVNSAATITTLGNKRMDADTQARQLLDRMAIDFAQMVKRDDVDFFAKGTVAPKSVGGAMAGNDRIAFYSAVPGYYPSTGSQSPVSLVGYRINAVAGATALNKMERLGIGLVWNGVATDTPVVFLPLTIGPSTSSPSGTWPQATSNTASDPAHYELIGPQVFRFEYCYVLTDGTRPITPPSSTSGIAAIIVDIAMIDPKSNVLTSNSQLTALAGQLDDYSAGMTPGQLLALWQSKLDANTSGLPRPAVSAIRLYERQFYLSPPTL